MHLKVVLVLLSACLLVNAQLSPDVQALVNIMESWRDTTADPCTDFFQYSCGTFIANNPIPANASGAYSFNPAFDTIGFSNDDLLKKIVNDPWPIVHDLYTSCIQDESLWNNSFTEFFINKVKTIEQADLTNDFFGIVSTLVNVRAPAFVVPRVEVDLYQRTIINIEVAGNTLPAELYSNSTYYNGLLDVVTNVFTILENPAQARMDAVSVLNLELQIALANENTTAATNMTVADLSNDTGLDFVEILSLYGVVATKDTYVIVMNADFIVNLLNGIRFLEWKLYSTFSPYLHVNNCWNNTEPSPATCLMYMGNSPYQPPWTQESVCRNLVHFYVTDLVGLIFNTEVVTPQVAGSIKNMTTGIQQAFNKSLPALNWLDDYSLASVQFKLAHVLQIIGHPNVMDRYENVSTTPTTFFDNLFNILVSTNMYYTTQLSLPFNRDDFEFDPMIINAFYDPSTNTINFPAGMLESPMFSGTWPKLFQYPPKYSRMGIVVGHENTHGFDNSGTFYNAYGLPQDILDPATRTNFANSATCIANFYQQYVVFGNTTIRGNQTLGENIADIGGIKNSFRAYQNFVAEFGNEFADHQLISDLTTDQVYFLHYGQTWCSVANDEFLNEQIMYDVHSPGKFRVNGPLSQFDEFAAAFNCPANAPMNPSPRCDLW